MHQKLGRVGLLCVLLVGCAHGKARVSTDGPPPDEARFAAAQPPAWVVRIPQEPEALYALGSSGPTYYPDDAIKNASDKARGNLGMAISAHVESAVLTVETTRGTYADTASAVDANHASTDTMIENSEIIATWVDRAGAYTGQPGTTFALARLDRKKAGLPAPPQLHPADPPPPAPPPPPPPQPQAPESAASH